MGNSLALKECKACEHFIGSNFCEKKDKYLFGYDYTRKEVTTFENLRTKECCATCYHAYVYTVQEGRELRLDKVVCDNCGEEKIASDRCSLWGVGDYYTGETHKMYKGVKDAKCCETCEYCAVPNGKHLCIARKMVEVDNFDTCEMWVERG